MDANMQAKLFFISAYFENLKERVSFLEKLYLDGRQEEALLLCCCYVEALGSRLFKENKSKNYCDILVAHGNNEFWELIHPMSMKGIIKSKSSFANIFQKLELILDNMSYELITPKNMIELLSSHLSSEQNEWLLKNHYKGSLAYISYDQHRSELVHDISTPPKIYFSQSRYNGKIVPSLDFNMLLSSLHSIVNMAEMTALSTGKWWGE